MQYQQGEEESLDPSGRLRVDPADRLSHAPPRGFKTGYLIVALAAIAAIAGIVMFSGDEAESPPAEPASVPAAAVEQVAPDPEPALPPAEDIPEPVVTPTPAVEEPRIPEEPPAPAMTLSESDEVVRESLGGVGGGMLVDQLQTNTDLLLRGAAYIDGLSRGLIMNKVLRLSPPAGRFTTLKMDGRTVMDPASYDRYDAYADAIGRFDTAQLASLFHRFRPLLEEAYADSGNRPDEFDNAVIRALDRVIATPEIDTPIPVKKKEAVYLYSDPALEQLAPLQKLLLRMGPENLRRVKQQARALRQALLQP